jgi:hypothetical protein
MANDVFDIKQHFRVQFSPTSGTWTNIVTDTYEVSIDRGITVEQGVFARPDVGTAEIRLMKTSLADMLNGPAYKSNMPIRIQYQPFPDSDPTRWESVFYGLIQNVAMSYQVDTQKLAVTITANDFMKVFLNLNVSSFSITGSSTVRSFRNVIASLATAVNALDSRVTLTQSGSTGSSTTQWAYTWTDTSAGEIATQLLDGELGWMYCNKNDSQLYYMTRNDVNAYQSLTWNTSNDTVSNVHTSATSHICMDNIDFQYNSDELVNSVVVTEMATSTTQTQTNSTSVATYGKQVGKYQVTFDNGGISNLANWASAVATAANPRSIKSVSVPAMRRDGTTSRILFQDPGSPLQLEFASTGLTTLQEIHLITRLTHNITAEHWEVTVGLWRGI